MNLQSVTTDVCLHSNKVTDYHEGTIVCLDCSHVIENQIFLDSCKIQVTQNNPKRDEMKEVLTRLNCSYDVLDDETLTSIPELYNKINLRNTVSLKDFCAATGLPSKTVTRTNKDTVSVQNFSEMLEKFCKLFHIDFKNYTVIKENISQKPHSGHPPLTVIGYHIYTYVKTVLKKKITIKDICETLGISSISIQRYRRHELSFRA